MATPTTAKPWLLLPIETKVRELHAKLLLAASAAEAGFDVVLAEQVELSHHLRLMPRGVYVEKFLAKPQVRNLRRNRALGNRVVGWCEEGLVYRNRDIYLRERLDGDALAALDLMFAWGEDQAEMVSKKLPPAAAKIRKTGNPRFDLLRPELRAVFAAETAALGRRYGRYLLITTNFGRINHFSGREFNARTLAARRTTSNDESRRQSRDLDRFISATLDGFIASLEGLSRAFPTTTIVIRPHPSENFDTWRRAAAGLANVVVAHHDNAIPWIAAAAALVHNSCTTGVEGYLLGTPVIAYHPVSEEPFETGLPNALSRHAYDLDGLVEQLRPCLDGSPVGEEEAVRDQRAATARRHMSALDGPLACDLIVAAIRELDITAHSFRVSPLAWLAKTTLNALSPLRPYVVRARGGVPVSRAYRRHKFPGLDIAELNHALAALRAATGRFADISIASLPASRHAFVVRDGRAP